MKKQDASYGGLKLEPGHYASPRWTYEILDCAMPMTFDTYSNCAHQCLYCFSFFQRAVGESKDDYLHHKVKAVNIEKVKAMFLHPDEYGGQFANYIKKRMVLQWGGLSDGFDFYERKFRASLELLKFFREIDYPISISTKGTWWVYEPEYREVVKDAKNMHWKYSIITTIEDHVRKLEPGVPPARERFRAMEELNKLGVAATTLRFRPFTIGTSDLCVEDMMKLAEDSGCYSVTTEFLTWESRASNTSRQRLELMSKVLGYDVWEFYMKNSARVSGLLRLNYDLKRPYILEMKESAEKHNLKFFVSDAHHKQESYHAGCCGLPETGPLSNVNHGQYAHAILIAKEKGYVQWRDIEDESKSVLGDIPVFQAEGFPLDSEERAKRRYQNMHGYMKDTWNNPKSWQSPARYFGGSLVPGNLDEDGNIVYLYNKPFIEEGVRIGSANELAIQLRMAGKPNADRFDEMTRDGSNFGYVAYPIYVISRGRWAHVTTIKMLEREKLNYTLVVPEHELAYYAGKFQDADLVAMPKKKKGAGAARAYVYDYCREQGNSFVWILDDDLVSLHTKSGEPTTLRAVLSSLEKFMEDWNNVALLGVYTQGEKRANKFMVNQMVRGLMLVNLTTGQGFDDKYLMYEDYEFALRHIRGGMVTVRYDEYGAEFYVPPGGGISSMTVESQDATRLQEAYPEAVALEAFRNTEIPPIPLIDTDSYTSVLNSRNIEALLKGE